MENSPLEYLARKYENVVLYDAAGNPSIFVKFPKMKSSELVAGLPNHTHPAFIINDVEQDYILLGKYKAGVVETPVQTIVSAPNIVPFNDSPSRLLIAAKKAGAGITGMTVADYGFIKLLAQKNGWTPKGNTNRGQSHEDATVWEAHKAVTVDTVRAYKGWRYQCLIAHTTSDDLFPDLAPAYWKRLNFIGGVVKSAYNGNSFFTLNGSGPMDWYLGKDLGNLSDIIGSDNEVKYGYRIVSGELQILPNNDAADPEADLSENATTWKAILPNANNDGYTLVAPGTSGTLKWNYSSGLILDTNKYSAATSFSTAFKNITNQQTRLPYVPHIVKELGLFPTDSNDETEGMVTVDFSQSAYLYCVGNGSCSSLVLSTPYSGLGRCTNNAFSGCCRPRAIPATP